MLIKVGMFLNGQNRQWILYALFALVLLVQVILLTRHTGSGRNQAKFIEVQREEIKSFDGSCRGLLWERYAGSIWPLPKSQSVDESFTFLSKQIKIKLSQPCEILSDRLLHYENLLPEYTSKCFISTEGEEKEFADFSEDDKIASKITVNIKSCSEWPSQKMNESHKIIVKNGEISISADENWGVLHALESILQSIIVEDEKPALRDGTISDEPRFSHRGLMLDTARHYLPVEILKAHLAAMSMNKLNVFQWHIVDRESFPYMGEKFPELAEKGAFSLNHIYTISDIREIIEFARVRGIRVIPEFDSPGHADAWAKGRPEDFLAECKGFANEMTKRSMDPSNEETYEHFDELWGELREVFHDEFIHLGGDEVDSSCYKGNDKIAKFMMKENIIRAEELQQYWNGRIFEICEKNKFKYMVWEEAWYNGFPEEEDLGLNIKENVIIGIWKDFAQWDWARTLSKTTNEGFNSILLAPWYLDWGANWDISNKGWEYFYSVNMESWAKTEDQKKLFIGGSGALWAEYVDATQSLSQTYPRLSSTAEKLWSFNTRNTPGEEEFQRLADFRCKMMSRGIPVAARITFKKRPDRMFWNHCQKPFSYNLDVL